jgi:hypothetical protein
MPVYRRVTRFIATAAAGAAILVGLTACWPFTATTAEDVGRAAAHSQAIRGLPAKAAEAFAEVPGALQDLNEATEGPVRNAVIATACDALASGNDPAHESSVLSNLLGDTQPPEKQLLGAVQDLVATFQDDERSGVTTPESIGLACKSYQLKDNVG